MARDVIAKHPKLPAILTTHELVNADRGNPVAYFTDHGNRDHSGRGTHLTRQQLAGDAQTASTEYHPDQPGHASWLFAGGKDPVRWVSADGG
jgi:hypothetical protein